MQQQQPPDLKIALVGDSVLDDHYWLEHPADDVRAQTERTLKLAHPDRSVQVHNYAVDESTVACVLYGRAPAAYFRKGRAKALMEPYPVGADGMVKPLMLLRKLKPTHVVSDTAQQSSTRTNQLSILFVIGTVLVFNCLLGCRLQTTYTAAVTTLLSDVGAV